MKRIQLGKTGESLVLDERKSPKTIRMSDILSVDIIENMARLDVRNKSKMPTKISVSAAMEVSHSVSMRAEYLKRP